MVIKGSLEPPKGISPLSPPLLLMAKRVGIFAGASISFMEVARNIAKVLIAHGATPVLEHKFLPDHVRKGFVESVLIVYTADPILALEYAPHVMLVKPLLKEKVCFYATIDGRPLREFASRPIYRVVSFVANSEWTRRMLTQAGMTVEDVVPHAVDFREVEQALVRAEELRKKIRAKFKDRVVFGVVSNDSPRKNLDGLAEACQYLSKKRDDFVVLAITEKKRPHLFEFNNFYFAGEFGTRSHVDILAFMAACDFLVHPSFCEGFGLPVLEAMAVGTPVVHCWYPPLSEFSDPKANITFPYQYEEEVEPEHGGQVYIFHRFSFEDLADAMSQAIDVARNREEYEERRIRARERAEEYDIYKVYSYFAKRLL